jgi:4-amino-4-deoxy-L-arabinose transferase-like glycosyltransferase
MLQAWLVLPALAACYLLAAPGAWLQRVRRCGAMTPLAVVISLSWMSLVTIWPTGSRPYIDGSTDNSVFQQVFIYNGFGRLDQATPDQLGPSARWSHPWCAIVRRPVPAAMHGCRTAR